MVRGKDWAIDEGMVGRSEDCVVKGLMTCIFFDGKDVCTSFISLVWR
jgi:hypothetical protein